jgi:phosphopantetheinyl transferase
MRASPFDEDVARVSISHSSGAGAAIVARRPRSVGVDLMPLGRLGARHAAAVLDDAERAALERIDPALVPTVAWTLKEATAKASGRAGELSLSDLRIRTHTTQRTATVGVGGEPAARFAAGWDITAGFVYAWALE